MRDTEETATRVPNEGNFSVDRDPWSGDFVLCHTISSERRTYQGFSDVYLEFVDDDGILVCHPDGAEGGCPPEFKCLEQELSSVYSDAEGRHFTVRGENSHPQPLGDIIREHRPVRVSFPCGPPQRGVPA